MEESKNTPESKKQAMKDYITKIFQSYENGIWQNKDCINKFCKNCLRRDLNIDEGVEMTKQHFLSAAVKIIKHDPQPYIATEWPPEQLWADKVDELLKNKDEGVFLAEITKVFWSFESLATSFYPISKEDKRFELENPSLDIDFHRLNRVYEEIHRISETEEGVFLKIMTESVTNVREQIKNYNKTAYKSLSKAFVRIMMIWLTQEILYDPMHEEITSLINELFFDLEGSDLWDRKTAEIFMSEYETENFLTAVKVNQQQLTFLMFDQPEDDTEEMEKVRRYFLILDFFYYASRLKKRNLISLKEFHNDLLNREWSKELPTFYLSWYDRRRNINEQDMDIDFELPTHEIDKRQEKFTYVCFPWAFDAASKARLMNYECQISRKKEIHNSLDISSLLMGGLNIYLVVQVARDQLIEDALNALVNAGKELKKPLKVKFKGEPGIDEGGVQKEFFQLLVRQIFDVGYGMFDYNEESHLYWIKKDTFESPLKYELVGIILGLAIYNGNILDIHFPLAIFKKLLDRKVTFEDFAQYSPQVAKSLKAILMYDKDDIKDVMGLTFTADYESWGTTVWIELKEGGKDIEVTNDNKEEYVELFIDFMMNKSIERWFASFKKGFDKCCRGEILPMIEPEDLEMLICGSKILDFKELKKTTIYQDGFTEESVTVQRFWEVIEEFTEDEKKKFLFFCTGCDRAPINGLGELRFFISKHGSNDDLLPSVHTWFNHFLLPDYSNKDILREKLLKAIHNSEGFGLI